MYTFINRVRPSMIGPLSAISKTVKIAQNLRGVMACIKRIKSNDPCTEHYTICKYEHLLMDVISALGVSTEIPH